MDRQEEPFCKLEMDPRAPSEPSKLGRPTLKSGAPVGNKLNSLLLGPKGPSLMADMVFLEEAAHFNRERLPERVVHAKGAAAFGHFVVTSTEICKYSKAALFAQQGKQTPVAVRFSHVVGESGAADTLRDVRGFAVKFYTEQGNWDLVGNNLPVFFVRDPINFASFIHSQKRNPRSHLREAESFWDFVSLVPETMHAILMLFSERGIPDGFRHMNGFGVNTFKLVNQKQEAFYAKFHWISNQGVRNLDQASASKLAGQDADYALRDLQTSISAGKHPSWTLKFQAMSVAAAQRASFNVFDVTKTWPHAEFPLVELGKMTLDQLADNYFAQVEQLAFSPANMVPGIEASPDKMLIGRMVSYPDAQRHRMGANYADVPVNQPRCPVLTPTYCDGLTFNSNLAGSMPNYLPSNKYNNLSKLTDNKYAEHEVQCNASSGRFDLSQDDNFSQARLFYNKVLPEESRRALASNLANHLALVGNKEIVAKVMRHFSEIEPQLVKELESFMMMKAAKQ